MRLSKSDKIIIVLCMLFFVLMCGLMFVEAVQLSQPQDVLRISDD